MDHSTGRWINISLSFVTAAQTWSHPQCSERSPSPSETFGSHIRCQKQPCVNGDVENIQQNPPFLRDAMEPYMSQVSSFKIQVFSFLHFFFLWSGDIGTRRSVCKRQRGRTWEEAEVWAPTQPLMLNRYLEVNEAVRKRWGELLWIHTHTHTHVGNVCTSPQRPLL